MEFVLLNIISAYRALRTHPLRSALSVLGIVIGVASVITLIGIGQGVKDDVTRQINSLGANVAFILPGKLDSDGDPGPMNSFGLSSLTDKDADDLLKLPGIKVCSPVMLVCGSVNYHDIGYAAFVVASSPGIFTILNRSAENGRFFTQSDDNKPVCVISHKPAELIFGKVNPVGRTILIQDKPFRIVGVLAAEERSIAGPGSFQGVIYLPYVYSRKAFPGGQINRIIVSTDVHLPPEPVINSIKSRLMANHKNKDDFGILTQKQLLNVIFKVFNIVTSLLVGIGSISLIVAGIGIMNIMLVTVTERTHEIGIRKAVGARRSDIFVQFITEAISLCVMGGFLGTTLSFVVCYFIRKYSSLSPTITPAAVLLSVGVCFAVGVLFGVAPAIRAARQNPIEALRWE